MSKNDQLATHDKNFDSHARKCWKSMLKLFIAKSFSRNFKNLSRIFCPELSEERLVCFLLNPYSLELAVSADFDNLKASLAVKIDI